MKRAERFDVNVQSSGFQIHDMCNVVPRTECELPACERREMMRIMNSLTSLSN